jgi:hypothetical protein
MVETLVFTPKGGKSAAEIEGFVSYVANYSAGEWRGCHGILDVVGLSCYVRLWGFAAMFSRP